MPQLNRLPVGTGNRRWLGSTHGVDNAPTGTLDVASFTEDTHYPNGRIVNGTPVDVTDLTAVKPYTAPAAGEAATKLGFLVDDVTVINGEAAPVAILRHGSIVTAEVPGDFEAPASAVGFIFE